MCLDDISLRKQFDTILVDGNHFDPYYSVKKDEFIPHYCIVKGDNTYKSIAAASVLAKTYRDQYMIQLVKDHPELEKYDISLQDLAMKFEINFWTAKVDEVLPALGYRSNIDENQEEKKNEDSQKNDRKL